MKRILAILILFTIAFRMDGQSQPDSVFIGKNCKRMCIVDSNANMHDSASYLNGIRLNKSQADSVCMILASARVRKNLKTVGTVSEKQSIILYYNPNVECYSYLPGDIIKNEGITEYLIITRKKYKSYIKSLFKLIYQASSSVESK